MEIQGLLIFMGIVGAYTFIILGCMERRLGRVVKHMEEEDSKYVN
jgi:hypothetical protein